MVFQDWSLCVTTSHLSYTFDQGCHCEAIVKVHGVLPSSRWYSASSRRIQFHRVHVGDSGAVVTPFVQVATYATRNFATLGQLELLPPFTGDFSGMKWANSYLKVVWLSNKHGKQTYPRHPTVIKEWKHNCCWTYKPYYFGNKTI